MKEEWAEGSSSRLPLVVAGGRGFASFDPPMERITQSYAESMRQLGARRDAGEQHWEASMSFFVAGNIFYFATLVGLRGFMQRRPAYNPTLMMQRYNIRYAGAGAPVRLVHLVTRRPQRVF